LIDLRKNKNELWSELSKSRKRGIRYAKRQNLIVEVMEDKKLMPVFYECLAETYKNAKIPLPDISLFEAVFDVLVPANMAQFFLVKHDKGYICGRVVLLFNKLVYAWYRGTKSDYLSLYPNDFVGWDTIDRYHEKGYKIFDFGGAGTTNEVAGIRDFKRQFGGILVNYGRYIKIHQPKKLWLSEKGFKVYRKVFIR
jgi:serine/alanine adding enzyme